MEQQQPASEFPHGPCADGKVYGMDHGQYGSYQKIIIMSEESWGKFGTIMESMRLQLQAQDHRIKELLAENAITKQVAADDRVRLDNLRDARRKEKRADIEKELITPGSAAFTMFSQLRK